MEIKLCQDNVNMDLIVYGIVSLTFYSSCLDCQVVLSSTHFTYSSIEALMIVWILATQDVSKQKGQGLPNTKPKKSVACPNLTFI